MRPDTPPSACNYALSLLRYYPNLFERKYSVNPCAFTNCPADRPQTSIMAFAKSAPQFLHKMLHSYRLFCPDLLIEPGSHFVGCLAPEPV